ncbi:hypothetical protein CRE_25218 [Caenorhabditis remanei]|uniref:Uncharacterized protein n=1 Tax=Caenorhabditis remanei TaxID=31234 RepID=E3LRZ5_CAERE|nr:hypothetical protein CRE_25218 [Caenorhabditis remanei]
MSTPVQVKRSRNQQPGTPIPSSRRREPSSLTAAVYNPPVSKLKKNYDQEFDRFLRSAKTIMDHLDSSEKIILSPMRKQLRRFHKESNSFDVYFKSQSYWKFFYKGLIDHCDDMMDCFRFDDLRDVDSVVDSHDLPDELISFVTQQLMEWRDLFKDVEWLKTFRELTRKVEILQQRRQEEAERLSLLKSIRHEFGKYSQKVQLISGCLFSDASNLDVQNFTKFSQAPSNISNSIINAIEESEKTQKPSDGLKNVPMLSKRLSVKRWYREHYDPSSHGVSDNESDDDNSSDDENSSLSVDSANSNIEKSEDFSSDEADNDNDFQAFFNENT